MSMQLVAQTTFLLLRLLVSSPSAEMTGLSEGPPIAMPNCQSVCGGVSIPYPFGIGPNSECYLEDWYEIECDTSTRPHKPFLKHMDPTLEVLNISLSGKLHVRIPVAFSYGAEQTYYLGPNLTGSPFVYSQQCNRFTAVSCGNFALVKSDPAGTVVGGCMSTCDYDTLSIGSCLGINCCQTTLPPGLTVISTELQSVPGEAINSQLPNDNFVFLVDQTWIQNNSFTQVGDMMKALKSVPVVLEWSFLLERGINQSYQKYSSYVESSISSRWKGSHNPTQICTKYNDSSPMDNRPKMKCLCQAGYDGNPYLPTAGCQDIDECKQGNPCTMSVDGVPFYIGEVCKNINGSYICFSDTSSVRCNYIADGSVLCMPETNRPHRMILGIGIGLGVLMLLFAVCCVYRLIRKRKTIERKKICFKRNGGLLLQQQLSSGDVNVQKIKLFTSNELEKSTDNFSINRVIGHGGHGTVYKGMLADGRIVAVKKSKKVDEGQLSEFINEVVILSQIKHRNVVRLLGCCLETEVPLLVYEFIPNGTLFQYIHEKNEEFPLTWKMRLRIATEVAGALWYLHVAASCPIYHRDIKSTNILLDEKYRAKIADFGTSRSVAVDQTHLTTLVHGTFGYLDPEYFRSSKFTEKSDVYSFGVVLVELLSGQKPVSPVNMLKEEEKYKSLAEYLIVVMQEDRLFDIIDAQVLNEASTREITTVANLARRCLNLNGKKRPTMKQVTIVLEAIQMSMTKF